MYLKNCDTVCTIYNVNWYEAYICSFIQKLLQFLVVHDGYPYIFANVSGGYEIVAFAFA